MADFTIATWNINSVRLRIDLVRRFVRKYDPHVLCLQETKVSDDRFPLKAFRRMGFEHLAINGQKGYHGVATASRIPFAETYMHEFCGKGDSRHVAVILDGALGDLEVHNFYVPAGGDDPDPEVNEKFAHKLSFLDEMSGWMRGWPEHRRARRIVVGDLNVAPLENDVWSHKQLLKVVSHTPVEVEKLGHVQGAHRWIDVARTFVPPEEKHYTWWSYRAPDWRKADKGRRLDHIWVSPALEGAPTAYHVAKEARGWKRASDHAPVIATLKLPD